MEPKKPISHVENIDCMIAMTNFPDKYFELAVVDPPYGIKESSKNVISRHHTQAKYRRSDWDNGIPSAEYFTELFRVSKNQIIWGGNYFLDYLPATSCMLYWDKDRYGDFADGEIAWTSFKTAVRHYKFTWDGFRKQIPENRIHPTEKPKQLYKWLLKNYAKEGDKILDTHLGSMSSRIAAYHMGFDFWGYEIDREYFEAGNKRFIEQTAQLSLL